ncbi:MAG: ATP-grasp domain-containing protein [Flavisolibacter sp.]
MLKEPISVLMTGAGAPGAPGIIQCLLKDPRLKLTVADADAEALGRHLHPDFVQIPRASDPDFAAKLLDICLQKNIQLVLPLVTRELFPFSSHKRLFEEKGIRILVSCEAAINIANNKAASYRFLREKGLPVPEFRVVKTAEAFMHAAYELGHPQNPFCFKPSVANGSRGFRVVSDSINESDQLFQQKPYNNLITYTHAVKILSAEPFPELVVSEFLPGAEFSVDCLALEGQAILVMPRLRLKMINGISVQGRFVKDERVIAYCREIIKGIGLHGNIGIQVRYSQKGQPLLLEINPRVQGTIVTCLGAGVNLPLLALQQECGWGLPAGEMEVRWGTSFSRFWTEVYY